MTSEMPPGADGRAHGHMSAYERALAMMRRVNGLKPEDLAVQAEMAEISKATPSTWDPAARTYVKATRGGPLDAPIVQHVGFGACPVGTPCGCPPVNVAAFQDKNIGVVGRGMSTPMRTMPRADLRSTDGSTGRFTKPARPPMDMMHPDLYLAPLPELERVDTSTPVLHEAPTPAPEKAKTDPHVLCKQEQAKLHARTLRAEHKLTRAMAEIERLKAELAKLAKPKHIRKGK